MAFLRRFRRHWLLATVLALAVIVTAPTSSWAQATTVPHLNRSWASFREPTVSWQTGTRSRELRMVDEASDRVVVEDIGPTELGERMIMAIVSSPDTIANLDEAKEIQRKLADPRGLSPGELEDLKARAKTVVMVAASIHATEVAGTQTCLNTLYELASSDTPRVLEILDNTILLLVPSLNPDGHEMVVQWYEEHLDTRSKEPRRRGCATSATTTTATGSCSTYRNR